MVRSQEMGTEPLKAGFGAGDDKSWWGMKRTVVNLRLDPARSRMQSLHVPEV